MRRRYFATFRLGGSEQVAPELSEVFERCGEWIFDPSHRLGQPADFGYVPEASRDWELGHGHRVRSRSYDGEGWTAFGLSYEHPDRGGGPLTWRTDVSAGRDHQEGPSVHTAVTLYAGHTNARMDPGDLPVSRPRIVRALISAFPARTSRLLQREPRTIRDGEVPEFVDFLTDPDRQLPVVFCSALNLSDKPIVDCDRLADQLVGLAHVYAGANRFTSFRLEDHLGRSLNTFDGAVRIYWPGLTKSDRPFRHNLWIARELVDRDRPFPVEILETIARISTTRVAPAAIRWEEFERRHAARRIRELQDEGEAEELIETYEEILAEQDAELEELRETVTELREEVEVERRQAESWRQVFLESQRAEDEAETAVFDQAPPGSMMEAARRVLDEFESRIVFPLNSKSELERSQFEDVEGFFQGLRWLATTFWEAKSGESPLADLDRACREACGFKYAARQAETTMGEYPSYYETTWNGNTVRLERHLARGASKDPRHTLRIGFAWDEASETVVVGFVGQHQRTGAT